MWNTSSLTEPNILTLNTTPPLSFESFLLSSLLPHMLLYLAIFFLSYIIMANILPHAVINSLKNMELQGGAKPSDDSDTKDVGHGAAFSPSPIDIVVARIMLARGLKLPTDLVNVIFDHAEYWAHSSNEIDYIAEHGDPLSILGKSSTNNRLVVSIEPRAH